MVQDLKPVTRRLTHLPDDELRAALRRLCLRLLPAYLGTAAAVSRRNRT